MGYRTSMSFPVEPHVTGTNPRVVLDASPSILSTYARAIDEYRRDAIHKLENLRDDPVSREERPPKLPNGSVQ
jgi:hypothetical protein